MIIPKLAGSLKPADFTIFTACDSAYFDEFGKELVNSALKNTTASIHIHVYNPSIEVIHWLKSRGISHSYEVVSHVALLPAANRWNNTPTSEFDKQRLLRIKKSMDKGNDVSIHERIVKTYYACARFIRLNELFNGSPILAIDIDAIIRLSPPLLPNDADFYIHKNKQFLAGGIYLTEHSKPFLEEYANKLVDHIQSDYLYWSLDQDILDAIVPNYNYRELPRGYIDWDMNPDSHIWTAKGKRKDLAIFKSEKSKYNY